MKLEQIQEFLVLGKHLNFSKAAEELYTSQSVLSRHIKSLEEELGADLLKRDTHSVELTDMGHAAMESFSAMMEEYQRLTHRIQNLKEGFTGKMVMGVTNLILEDYFEHYIDGYTERYPGVETELKVGHVAEVIQSYLREETDIAMIIDSKPEFPGSYFFTVATQPFYCAVSLKNPLSQKAELSLSDLDGQALVYPPAKQYRDYVNPILEANHIQPRKIIEVTDDNLLYRAIRNEDALSLCPAQLGNYPHKGVVLIPFNEPVFTMHIGFVFRRSNHNPAILRFLDFLIDEEMEKETPEL